MPGKASRFLRLATLEDGPGFLSASLKRRTDGDADAAAATRVNLRAQSPRFFLLDHQGDSRPDEHGCAGAGSPTSGRSGNEDRPGSGSGTSWCARFAAVIGEQLYVPTWRGRHTLAGMPAAGTPGDFDRRPTLRQEDAFRTADSDGAGDPFGRGVSEPDVVQDGDDPVLIYDAQWYRLWRRTIAEIKGAPLEDQARRRRTTTGPRARRFVGYRGRGMPGDHRQWGTTGR